jgi:hypothetical protein
VARRCLAEAPCPVLVAGRSQGVELHTAITSR